MSIHVVSQGETIADIAAEYGVSPNRLSFDNQLSEQDHLVAGQALLVLQPDVIHETARGETIPSIAARYGVHPLQIVRNNPFLTSQPFLRQGQYLVILYRGQSDRPLTADGYAYPFIDKEILEQSFPALKELLVFSYGFTFEGNLVPPLQDDLWMIETAWRHGAKPIMVLTPFSEGAFNNQLVKVLTENVEVQERLLEQLTAEVRRRGFAGVNIDFEYVLPENKVQYAAFIGKMRELLRPEGYTVSVAVPPKVSNEQRGLLVEGADYRLIGGERGLRFF